MLSPAEKQKLKDRFVDNFVHGLSDGLPLPGTAKRVVGGPDVFLPSWPTEKEEFSNLAPDGHPEIERVVDSMMGEDNPVESQPCSKPAMPDFLGVEGTVISTGGAASISAVNQGFATLELFNVVVSAIVTSSIRLADFRSWGAEMVFQSVPLEDSETRGVFCKIWTAEVYVRNSVYNENRDNIWLLACPTRLYPNGLCALVQVCVGS